MIDLTFSVSGDMIPADSVYDVFGALSRIWPEIHQENEIGIFQVSGRLNKKSRSIEPSRLKLRLPLQDLPKALDLRGQTLDLQGKKITLIKAEVKPLQPHSSLYSHMVVIKGYTKADAFLDACKQEIISLGIRGEVSLKQRTGDLMGKEPYLRRTVNISGKTIVGYGLVVTGLSGDDSILLQTKGLGGRRHFGCGLFVRCFA